MTPIILVGKDLGAYTFDASLKTVTLTGLETLILEQVIVIHNATRGIDIYNPIDANKLGSIASNVITLAFDTTSMADTDDLIIKVWYSAPDLVIWGDKTLKVLEQKLRVVNNPYYSEIALGNVANHVPFHMLGYNPSTPALSVMADLSELGVNVIPVPSVATPMEVVSTSINDAAAGTGVRIVEIHGLDALYNVISETLTMNGTTPVATVNSYLRLNSFHAKTVGSFGATAAGDITLQTVGGATIYRQISVGGNKDRTAHYTIPAGMKGLILNYNGSSTGKETDVLLRATVDENRNLMAGVYRILGNVTSKDGGMSANLSLPHYVPAKCDIKASAIDIDGAGGGTANINMELFYEPV